MPNQKAFVFYLFAGLCWVTLLVVGFSILERYESTPGRTLASRDKWPTHSAIQADLHKPTLLMFVHPQCPCSRASVSELSEMAESVGKRIRLYVVFYKPSGFPPDWDKTETWRMAGHIPGAIRVEDPDGKEAARFNSATSGQAMLYSAQGQLLFSGGLTNGRGQTGLSGGRLALMRLIDGQASSQPVNFVVFGCPLFSFKSTTLLKKD
jgi:hypothetical protein